MRFLRLSENLEEPMSWFLESFGDALDTNQYRMGGGSILVARWHHRHSVDLDFFFDERDASVDLERVMDVAQ